MSGIQLLACLWTLLITQTRFGLSDMTFLERHEGESVVLACVVDHSIPSPFGVYLRRSWLRPGNVLFMYTMSDITVADGENQRRISVSGDPSSHAVNMTVSQLRVSDTDRYYCEFVVNHPFSEDQRIRGSTEFVLHVTADASGAAEIGLVQTCAGGSAVLPCLPPSGEDLVVEGVSLKRQRGRAPVELLYHSKRHHGSSSPSSSPEYPGERVQLSSAPGPSGITYNLTLHHLQPHESGLYSCQLLVRRRSNAVASLGRQVFFVSVQDSHCNCSSYSTLLYALSSAVAALLILALVGFVLIYQGKASRSVKSHPQVPIYEEMAVVQPLSGKARLQQLGEVEGSEYRNCRVKNSCPENHYESPRRAVSEMKY